MKTATELARELPPGPELDALFFEACYPDMPPPTAHDEATGGTVDLDWPSVSEDTDDCEAWALCWAVARGLRVTVESQEGTQWQVEIENGHVFVTESGNSWEHALVRACIVAAEAMKEKGATHGD